MTTPPHPTDIGYAEEAITHREAVERLTEHGYDQATAQRMVADYLDDTSREIGVSLHQWGMDQHDVDAIIAAGRGRYAPMAVPAQRSATEIPEQERREQLARWQADDEQPDADVDAAVRER